MNVIDDSYISYIKWDMNRCMSEVYSSTHDVSSQGRVMHEYILGVYHLYDVLTTKYPDILFDPVQVEEHALIQECLLLSPLNVGPVMIPMQ